MYFNWCWNVDYGAINGNVLWIIKIPSSICEYGYVHRIQKGEHGEQDFVMIEREALVLERLIQDGYL